jgi:hypothetical protein
MIKKPMQYTYTLARQHIHMVRTWIPKGVYADGKPIGIELLCVSTGVNTDKLPYRTEVEKLLGDRGIKIYAQN